MATKYFGGCDIGSATGKTVIIDEQGAVLATTIIPSEIDPEVTSVIALKKACENVDGLASYKDLSYLVPWVLFPAPRPSRPLLISVGRT